MKKNLKKVAALVAATALVSTTVVGCGTQDAKESTTAGKEVETQVSESVPASETSKEFSYPMEGRSITIWGNNPGSAFYEDYSDSLFNLNVEKATGIDIQYTHPGDNKEAFNLMLADGVYKDIISYNWSTYAGGLVGAYEDGIAIELNDIIDQYMPNFKAFLEEHPEVDKGIKTDEGKYYAIPACTSDAKMGNVHGWYIRQDIMEQLQLEIPTTLDGWHDLLVTLKEKLGIAPITGTTDILKSGAFLNAFSPSMIASSYSINAESGEVEFTGATENYKEFLRVMVQWYNEGLIDKDFITNDNAAVKAKILSGEAVMSWGYAGSALQTIALEGMETNPEFALEAIPGCSAEEGAEILYTSADATFGAGVYAYSVITTACEDVEAAARYLDFMFSEEGILISNFGIEGETYTMVNGVPTYTDEILKNPEGLTIAQALRKYVRSFQMFPGVQTLEYLQGYYQLDNVKVAPETWGKYGTTEYEVPTAVLSYTEEENKTMSNIATNIQTEFEESRVKFVLGTLDIDKDWDAYIARLESFGLQDAVAINQAAYNRYLSR